MRRIVFIVFFLGLSSIFYSQTVTISGYVKDAETGEVLYGATVYDRETKLGVITNEYGFYSLDLPIDTLADISVSYIGYRVYEDYYACTDDQTINFYLEPDNELEEVIIQSKKEKPIQERNEMGVVQIPVRQIKTLPALGGETDIIKALQLMPGVQSGQEGSSQLYVRGGSPDQNLMLLDDVSLYNVNHLGGFVSVFNTDAINNVKLIKGGFPAKYGNRLSSIVDIRMKEGNNREFKGKATIGIVASKVSVEGPLKNENTSYLVSVRRMLFDLLMRPVSYFAFEKSGSVGYHFYDINAKINHRLSDNNRLFFSLYGGDDKLGLTGYGEDIKVKYNTRWGNRLAALRYNHIFNDKLFSNTTLSYTRYRFLTENIYKEKTDDETNKFYNSFKSAINDLKLKSDLSYYIRPGYHLRFGLEGTHHTFRPGVSTYQYSAFSDEELDTIIGGYRLNSLEGATYVENDIKLGKHFGANLGLRYNLYLVEQKYYTSFEPRVLLNYRIKDRYALKASYSKMQQNIHLLTSAGMGMPVDLWLPATSRVPPQSSEQWSLGFAQTIGEYLEFSMETYYKTMRHLIAYKDGASYMGGSTDWQDKIEKNGEGTSYGVEILLQKKEGKNTGWVSYTLAKTDRHFAGINEGKAYPFKYDRRHDISIVFNRKLTEKIDFSATWNYGSGYPYTLAIGKYELPENVNYIWRNYPYEIYIYDGRNNERMRDFHRLDIGFNFHKIKKNRERIWNVSVFNVYNRQNPYYYFYGTEYDKDEYGNIIEGTGRDVIKQQSLFPILLSVSYSWKF